MLMTDQMRTRFTDFLSTYETNADILSEVIRSGNLDIEKTGKELFC